MSPGILPGRATRLRERQTRHKQGMSLIGLSAWMCLLVSAFAYTSTFFEGGSTVDGSGIWIMNLIALALFAAASRDYRRDGRRWREAFPLSSVGVLIAVALFLTLNSYRIQQSGDVPGPQASQTEAFQRFHARAWAGIWILAYALPALFYSRRPPTPDPVS